MHMFRDKKQILVKDLKIQDGSFHKFKNRKLFDLKTRFDREKLEEKLRELTTIKQKTIQEKKALKLSSPFNQMLKVMNSAKKNKQKTSLTLKSLNSDFNSKISHNDSMSTKFTTPRRFE